MKLVTRVLTFGLTLLQKTDTSVAVLAFTKSRVQPKRLGLASIIG